ncbi:MAG: hypothetical protein KAY32_17135 [Candidatus Eisenbacteria sp.]|nr:hypothetical protein [Candidatus Eisenbacteria bacterium]
MSRQKNEGTQPEALQRFLATVGEIQLLLDAMREAADNRFGTEPEKVGWADLGDAQRVLAGLKEIRAMWGVK